MKKDMCRREKQNTVKNLRELRLYFTPGVGKREGSWEGIQGSWGNLSLHRVLHDMLKDVDCNQ